MSLVMDKPVVIPAQLEGEFQTLLAKAFASEPEWLKGRREKAFANFSKMGIPNRKDEEYKYTDVKKIFSKKFTAVHHEPQDLKFTIDKIAVSKDSLKLVFVNGWLYRNSTLRSSIPEGVIIGNMAADLFSNKELVKKRLSENGSVFSEMNSALWTDGALIYIPSGWKMQHLIEIINIYTGNKELLVSPRHLIIADANAEVSIVEQHISNDTKNSIVNAATDVFVGENARVQFYRVQNECRNVQMITSIHAIQEKNSHFDTNTISLGNDFVRNNLSIALNGENCETHLNGLFVTKGNEFIDNHTAVRHNKPNCQSNQLYKGILDEKSTGIFNGKIFVERDAQKTNAYQSSKNILLSDDATINTKPELEIYADDVKCSHGSSTGKVDEDALFYLRTRGLGEDSARRLLLSAFANDVLETIRIESLKNYLEELVDQRLQK